MKTLAVRVVLWKVGNRSTEPFSYESGSRMLLFRNDWLWNFRRSLSRQNEKMLWKGKRCGRRIVSLLILAGLYASLGCVSCLKIKAFRLCRAGPLQLHLRWAVSNSERVKFIRVASFLHTSLDLMLLWFAWWLIWGNTVWDFEEVCHHWTGRKGSMRPASIIQHHTLALPVGDDLLSTYGRQGPPKISSVMGRGVKIR